MKIREPRFIVALLLVGAIQTTYADTNSPLEQPLPDGQVAIPAAQAPALPPAVPPLQTVEVRNNSNVSVFVVQKGLKEALPSKSTLERDINQYPLTITPVEGAEKLQFVTLTGKTGPCKQQFCLIVQ
ncbi:hypothetical protein HBO12_14845 [Pseudomonas sp. WS 5059]|uniref:hypothetical protein n=1 Tax=Pseudomonas sp. WS 5059 TaxID=2717491 RepID=UPI0014766123|nr:hypothetical protein [Pseudomonas sp. WS 5059]NMY04238.1 hypothetical protein [Pseudomonas sp. WS 5059]